MNIGNVLIDRIDSLRQHGPGGDRTGQQPEAAADMARNDEPTRQMVQDSVVKLNKAAGQLNERISFSYNETVNRVVVKVINEDTNEVIREIPPRDIIKLTEHIQQYLGMIVDESR